MKYNFDKTINRKETDSVKWSKMDEIYGRDMIAMWIADMDFQTSPEIIEVLKEKIETGIFGYYKIEDEVFQSVIDWIDKRHGVKIEKEWIVFIPGVVAGLNLVAENLTQAGDNIIVQTPAYPRFFDLGKNHQIEIISNELKFQDGKFEMDYEDLKSGINDKTKFIIVCNPQNPTGRVWTREELDKIIEISEEKDLIIISDDIHSDIIRCGKKYTPIIGNKKALDRTISFFAPSKTFNLAGMGTAVAIIPDREIRQKITLAMEKIHMPLTNTFGKDTLKVAYNSGEDWLEELKIYLDENIKYTKEFIEENIKDLGVYVPEGTYLMWLDFSKLGMDNGEINKYLLESGLLLNNGEEYGKGGEHSFRINMACPKDTLIEGLNRLKLGIEKISEVER